MHFSTTKELRLASSAILISICIFIYISQELLLPDYFFIDSQTIYELIKYHDLTNYPKNSFTTTAYIYKELGSVASQILILGTVVLTIIFITKNSKTVLFLAIAFLFTIPFCIFNLKPSKENIVIIINLTICITCRNGEKSNALKLLTISCAYFIYSYYFRPYFAFIAAIAPALYLIANNPGKRLILIAILLLACLMIPAELWNQLQLSRDIVNEGREGLSNSKTAFNNFLEPNGFLTAVPNSVYGLIRFYLSPIFSFRVQEIALSSILWGVTYLALKNCDLKSPISCLIAANLILQTFFEPDLGSFFRHMMAYIFCVYATPK